MAHKLCLFHPTFFFSFVRARASGCGMQSCGLPAANSRSFINTYEEFITIYYCYVSNMHNVQEETQ